MAKLALKKAAIAFLYLVAAMRRAVSTRAMGAAIPITTPNIFVWTASATDITRGGGELLSTLPPRPWNWQSGGAQPALQWQRSRLLQTPFPPHATFPSRFVLTTASLHVVLIQIFLAHTWWAQTFWAQTEAQEVPSEHEEELLPSEGDGALEQAVESPSLEIFKTHLDVQPAVGDPASAGGLD